MRLVFRLMDDRFDDASASRAVMPSQTCSPSGNNELSTTQNIRPAFLSLALSGRG
jgi:hypothetical protein